MEELKGADIVKKPEFMVYCNLDLRGELEKIAKQEKRSLSNLAVMALEDFVREYTKTDNTK